MIQIIIFSFNRAMQLNTLLQSLIQNWTFPSYHITVLYNSSNRSFEEGYDLLKKKYPKVVFEKETLNNGLLFSMEEVMHPFNWKKIVRSSKLLHPNTNFKYLLNKIISRSKDCSYLMFLTDDSKFIDNVYINDLLLQWISDAPSQNSISLRLGEKIDMAPISQIKVNNEIIEWSFKDIRHFSSWSYEFSVDGHIYDKQFILTLLRSIMFYNPSTLEANVYDYVHRLKLLSFGKAFIRPLLLSFPINIVQTTYKNESLDVSCEALNDKFLNGITLDYPLPTEINKFQQYPDKLLFTKNNLDN